MLELVTIETSHLPCRNFRHVQLFLNECLQDEKYDHIEKADIDKVEKLWTEKSNWFGHRITQMAQLKPHENPIVLAAQVRAEKQV